MRIVSQLPSSLLRTLGVHLLGGPTYSASSHPSGLHAAVRPVGAAPVAEGCETGTGMVPVHTVRVSATHNIGWSILDIPDAQSTLHPARHRTKVLEGEAMASCVSKLALVPASTLRGAIVAALTRVTSASNDVTKDGCCTTRVGNTTAGVVNTADSVSTIVASFGAGGAVVVMMLVCGQSKYSGWNRQTRSSAQAQSSV